MTAPPLNDSLQRRGAIDVAAAGAAFRRYFLELNEVFLEREALFVQLELALLCREHVLIIGPPGTAKSAVAGAVLGRIVDASTGRPSLFSRQLTESSVQTDLVGPVDFKVLTETGRTVHLTDEGMLGSAHAFLDEVFDGRDMLLRSILNVLHERELKAGQRVTSGKCDTVVMTSNRYLSEVLQRSPESLQAFADRISFICFTPKGFARASSRARMLQSSTDGLRFSLSAQLTLQQLEALAGLVDEVEVDSVVQEGLETLADGLERELQSQVTQLPDYVSTKYFSQRTLVKALRALKASVVRDRLVRHPDRPLRAELSDLESLRAFFLLGGPTPREVELLLKSHGEPRERAQLEILRVEHKAFDLALARVASTLAQAVQRESAELSSRDDLAAAEGLSRSWSSGSALALARSLRDKLVPGPRHAENRAPLARAAELLLEAAEVRITRGLAGQGEGRGGPEILTALMEVLELARQVPELEAAVRRVAGEAVAFARQLLHMAVLTCQAAEFDERARLESLTALAGSVKDELLKVSELLQLASLVDSRLAGALGQEPVRARTEAAQALRQRARRLFVQPVPVGSRGSDLQEVLRTEGRRLKELERALVELSPDQAGLRAALLTPMAAGWLADLARSVGFTRLEQLARTLDLAMDAAVSEGVDAAALREVLRPLLATRAFAHAEGLPGAGFPPVDRARALSGEAYMAYRQELSARSPEGEEQGLAALQRLAGDLAPRAADRLAEVELHWLEARVAYCRAWLDELARGLPELGGAASADRAFDALVKSRLPMLFLREGELVRLTALLERWAAGHPSTSPRAGAALGRLRDVGADFMLLSRRVLDARGGASR